MTMKWNIKLDMENLTDGLIAIHSFLTSRWLSGCFNFLTYRTKILKFYCQRALAHLPLPQPHQPSQV